MNRASAYGGIGVDPSTLLAFYQACAEQAWRAGLGDEFLLMLERLRFESGIDGIGEHLSGRLAALCQDDPHCQYVLAVSLAAMVLVTDESWRRLVEALAALTRTHPRLHAGRGSGMRRRLWRRNQHPSAG